jgi:thioredoxin reductase (NADPH)
LILSENAAHVTLAHRGRDFRARAEFTGPAKKHPKVTILTETEVVEVTGGARIESVALKDRASGRTQILPVDALLIRIGVAPNTEQFLGKLEFDKDGYIKVDQYGETSLKGVYAVGDVANPIAPTISSAAGMGATAAKAIFSRLQP